MLGFICLFSRNLYCGGICLYILQGNPSTSMQIQSTGIQADSCPTVANRLECPVSYETQKPLQQPISPSRFSQMSLQQSQLLQGSPQSSRQSGFELPTKRTSNSSIEQQHDHQVCLNSKLICCCVCQGTEL